MEIGSESNEAIAHYSLLNKGRRMIALRYSFALPTEKELGGQIVAEGRHIEDEACDRS